MLALLEHLRKINKVLQNENTWTLESIDLPFDSLSQILGPMLQVDLFILSKEGRVLGTYDAFRLNNQRMQEYIDQRQFPQFYLEGLLKIEQTIDNLDVYSEMTIFPIEQADEYLNGKTTIIPIFASGRRLGTVIMGKSEKLFSTADLILAEHAASVIGTELLHWKTKHIEKEKRERESVKAAFKTLSFSELEAIKVIFSLFDGLELKFTALKISQDFGITRTVIVNAIRKLESGRIIDSRSLGAKGTYIKIRNENIYQAMDEELKKL